MEHEEIHGGISAQHPWGPIDGVGSSLVVLMEKMAVGKIESQHRILVEKQLAQKSVDQHTAPSSFISECKWRTVVTTSLALQSWYESLES